MNTGTLAQKPAWDATTGRMTFPDGVVVCYHARQTSAARDFAPGWVRRRDGRRWTLRYRSRLVRVVTTTCPDCPASRCDFVDPYSGLWMSGPLAPYLVAPKGEQP